VLRHRFNFLLSLPQSETETIMAEALSGYGVQVEWRTALVGLKQERGEIRAMVDGPAGRRELTCKHLFGADGVHSAVRSSVGIAFDGCTHQRLWSIADAEIANWPYEPRAAHAFLHRDGDVGFIIPIGEVRFRTVSNTADALARIPGGFSISRVLRTDTFQIPSRQAQRYQIGGVFLGGDAAHVHSPIGARGMNLGIEDAASFASRLVANALDGYSAERWPVGRRWMQLSERMLAAAQASNTPAITLRNLVFRVFGSLPLLQRPMLEHVAGLRE
jgi:2-polyprenyl-6-methoxyphenol hydroxylase-like FAD-dependent oxidoreductase